MERYWTLELAAIAMNAYEWYWTEYHELDLML